MNRIEIELGMWESAPCPIYTKNVDVDRVEKELYQQMICSFAYTKEEVEDYITNDKYRGDGWTSEWERFQEFLCAEEEALVMKYGGVYYEDMAQDTTCPYCDGDLIIESKNGLSKCLECGNEF